MPQATKPQTVTVNTQDGEVSIRLTIDLNLNVNGLVSANVAAVSQGPEALVQKEKVETKDTEWIIPDFASSTEKIEFGKYEK